MHDRRTSRTKPLGQPCDAASSKLDPLIFLVSYMPLATRLRFVKRLLLSDTLE